MSCIQKKRTSNESLEQSFSQLRESANLGFLDLPTITTIAKQGDIPSKHFETFWYHCLATKADVEKFVHLFSAMSSVLIACLESRDPNLVKELGKRFIPMISSFLVKNKSDTGLNHVVSAHGKSWLKLVSGAGAGWVELRRLCEEIATQTAVPEEPASPFSPISPSKFGQKTYAKIQTDWSALLEQAYKELVPNREIETFNSLVGSVVRVLFVQLDFEDFLSNESARLNPEIVRLICRSAFGCIASDFLNRTVQLSRAALPPSFQRILAKQRPDSQSNTDLNSARAALMTAVESALQEILTEELPGRGITHSLVSATSIGFVRWALSRGRPLVSTMSLKSGLELIFELWFPAGHPWRLESRKSIDPVIGAIRDGLSRVEEPEIAWASLVRSRLCRFTPLIKSDQMLIINVCSHLGLRYIESGDVIDDATRDAKGSFGLGRDVQEPSVTIPELLSVLRVQIAQQNQLISEFKAIRAQQEKQQSQENNETLGNAELILSPIEKTPSITAKYIYDRAAQSIHQMNDAFGMVSN